MRWPVFNRCQSSLSRAVPVALLAATIFCSSAPPDEAPAVEADAPTITWQNFDSALLEQAQQERRPVIVYFHADWCVPCIELDRYTFSDPGVVESAESFIRTKVDWTEYASVDDQLQPEAALLKERAITSKDAPIPGVMVEDVATARAQQDAIEKHTFGRFGPYSGMERDDPNRDVYLKGLTLRNALNLAVLAFGVADMAIGLGGVTIVLGIIVAGLAFPVHALVRTVARLDARV